mmetsp:Transcript_5940/g.20806  ORF Transcript_5940/g.20806 Transcript_5940/m.20806 type:complete len:309 (-) Transcript_5940:12-938(-)
MRSAPARVCFMRARKSACSVSTRMVLGISSVERGSRRPAVAVPGGRPATRRTSKLSSSSFPLPAGRLGAAGPAPASSPAGLAGGASSPVPLTAAGYSPPFATRPTSSPESSSAGGSSSPSADAPLLLARRLRLSSLATPTRHADRRPSSFPMEESRLASFTDSSAATSGGSTCSTSASNAFLRSLVRLNSSLVMTGCSAPAPDMPLPGTSDTSMYPTTCGCAHTVQRRSLTAVKLRIAAASPMRRPFTKKRGRARSGAGRSSTATCTSKSCWHGGAAFRRRPPSPPSSRGGHTKDVRTAPSTPSSGAA